MTIVNFWLAIEVVDNTTGLEGEVDANAIKIDSFGLDIDTPYEKGQAEWIARQAISYDETVTYNAGWLSEQIIKKAKELSAPKGAE